MICNGCGKERPGSKEHLIHAAVGRAVLGLDASVPGTQVRQLLRQELGGYRVEGADLERSAHLGDKTIFGLLCRDCNGGWANDLEEATGRHLSQFLDGAAPGNGLLLRRWAAYFAAKAFWADHWPRPLTTGFLHPVMRLLANPDVRVGISVRITYFKGEKREPLFLLGTGLEAEREYVFFVLRGVGWLVFRESPSGPTARSREVADGLSIDQYPKVSLNHLPAFLPTSATAALQRRGFFKGVKVIPPGEEGG